MKESKKAVGKWKCDKKDKVPADVLLPIIKGRDVAVQSIIIIDENKNSNKKAGQCENAFINLNKILPYLNNNFLHRIALL